MDLSMRISLWGKSGILDIFLVILFLLSLCGAAFWLYSWFQYGRSKDAHSVPKKHKRARHQKPSLDEEEEALSQNPVWMDQAGAQSGLLQAKEEAFVHPQDMHSEPVTQPVEKQRVSESVRSISASGAPAVQKPVQAENKPVVNVPVQLKPAQEEPVTQKPVQQRNVSKPAANIPVAGVPVMQKPAVNIPAAPKPAVNVPVAGIPVMQKPAAANTPVVQKPVQAENKPAANIPVVQKPIANIPAVPKSAVNIPVAGIPVMQKPAAANAPVVQKPVQAENKPVANVPVQPKTAQEEPVTQKPVQPVQQRNVSNPAMNIPVAGIPVMQKPAANIPVSQRPAVNIPVRQRLPVTQEPPHSEKATLTREPVYTPSNRQIPVMEEKKFSGETTKEPQSAIPVFTGVPIRTEQTYRTNHNSLENRGEMAAMETEPVDSLLRSASVAPDEVVVGPLTLCVRSGQHIGSRPQQQDAFAITPIDDRKTVETHGVMAVLCDGMGGLALGAEAANTGVIRFMESYLENPTGDGAALRQALKNANSSVWNMSVQAGQEGSAGSTLVAACVSAAGLNFISVGDSHLYVLRDGVLRQLNKDHNYFAELLKQVREGKLSMQEARLDPERTHLTSYLGMREMALIDQNVKPIRMQHGDLIILASDGLFKVLSVPEMTAILRAKRIDALKPLLNAVLQKDRPSFDNITVILMECRESRRG